MERAMVAASVPELAPESAQVKALVLAPEGAAAPVAAYLELAVA